MFTSSVRGHADDLQNPVVASLTQVKSCPRRQQAKLLKIILREPTEHSCCLLSQVFIRWLLVDKRSVSYISTLWLLWCCSAVTVYGSNNSKPIPTPRLEAVDQRGNNDGSVNVQPLSAACHMFPAADWWDSMWVRILCLSKTETLRSVEMKPAIASQHCQLEAPSPL